MKKLWKSGAIRGAGGSTKLVGIPLFCIFAKNVEVKRWNYRNNRECISLKIETTWEESDEILMLYINKYE